MSCLSELAHHLHPQTSHTAGRDRVPVTELPLAWAPSPPPVTFAQSSRHLFSGRLLPRLPGVLRQPPICFRGPTVVRHTTRTGRAVSLRPCLSAPPRLCLLWPDCQIHIHSLGPRIVLPTRCSGNKCSLFMNEWKPGSQYNCTFHE